MVVKKLASGELGWETKVDGFAVLAASVSLALEKCERNGNLRIVELSDCC